MWPRGLNESTSAPNWCFVHCLVSQLRAQHITDIPWENLGFKIDTLLPKFPIQSASSLAWVFIGVYHCVLPQLYHIIYHLTLISNMKFTIPPTQTDSSGTISIWIATAFDALVRYPWCSGCKKTQWQWDLREKSTHRSSHTVRYPTSIYGAECIWGVIL